MQSKVDQTRMHKVVQASNKVIEVCVTDIKLKLVAADKTNAKLFEFNSDKILTNKVSEIQDVSSLGKFLNPVGYSDSERIREGDYGIYNWLTDEGLDNWHMGVCLSGADDNLYLYFEHGIVRNNETHNWIPLSEGTKKVLVFPKQFSQKQIDAIVDNKFQEDKSILVECDQYATVKSNTKWIYAGARLKVDSVYLKHDTYGGLRLSLVDTHFQEQHGKSTVIRTSDLILDAEIKLNDGFVILYRNPESIESLLKLREQIEDKITALDPKALVMYELKRLTDGKKDILLYTEDELLDAVTTFNISTNFSSARQAKQEFPELFNSKREFTKNWIVNFFNKK